MKAITVRQPWAWQILHQGKDVENRTRNIAGSYRGLLAIHAGLTADEPALRDLPMHAPEWVTTPRVFDYGVILGTVELIGVHPDHAGCCESPWAQRDAIHLELANPVPLSKPVPARGRLGLWDLTPEQLRDVVERRQLAA